MVTAHCGSGTGSRKGLVVGGKVEALHIEESYVSFARTEAIVSLVHVVFASAESRPSRGSGEARASRRVARPQCEGEQVDPR